MRLEFFFLKCSGKRNFDSNSTLPRLLKKMLLLHFISDSTGLGRDITTDVDQRLLSTKAISYCFKSY